MSFSVSTHLRHYGRCAVTCSPADNLGAAPASARFSEPSSAPQVKMGLRGAFKCVMAAYRRGGRDTTVRYTFPEKMKAATVTLLKINPTPRRKSNRLSAD